MESPLAAMSEWVETKCSNNKQGKRETNTMPQWAGSSWYYLRYIDPNNKSKFVSKKNEAYRMPVDVYVGGVEHATRHLIYARFWHKFLYDNGLVSTKEPFKRLEKVGIILDEKGKKMSKRDGNVVNPDDVIEEYGADALRLYIMFLAPFSQNTFWNPRGILGMSRFLDRIYNLRDKVKDDIKQEEKFNKILNYTVKKVETDINEFKFNTAISQIMILVNDMEKKKSISKESYEKLLIILSPFCPFITESLWHQMGHKKSIHLSKYPKYSEKSLKEDTTVFVIQINGKVRGTINMPTDSTEEVVVKKAKGLPRVKKMLKEGDYKRVIWIPNKLINFTE